MIDFFNEQFNGVFTHEGLEPPPSSSEGDELKKWRDEIFAGADRLLLDAKITQGPGPMMSTATNPNAGDKSIEKTIIYSQKTTLLHEIIHPDHQGLLSEQTIEAITRLSVPATTWGFIEPSYLLSLAAAAANQEGHEGDIRETAQGMGGYVGNR